MKKFLSLILCLATLFSLTIPCFALETTTEPQVFLSEETTTEDGITITDTLTVYDQAARSSTRKATRERTITKSGTTIAIIAITATFRFDGSTVSVVSKSVSKKETYDGWTFTQTSFTSSGGTVTLKGTLTKLLCPRYAVNMTLSCDKDGNIS